MLEIDLTWDSLRDHQNMEIRFPKLREQNLKVEEILAEGGQNEKIAKGREANKSVNQMERTS